MLVIILHSLARLLLQTLNIMFRIRNLLSIRFNLFDSPRPRQQSSYDHLSSQIPIAPNEETYCRLRITTQLPLPMALALFLLIQLVILVVVDLRFALLCILVCRPINQSINQQLIPSTLHFPT